MPLIANIWQIYNDIMVAYIFNWTQQGIDFLS